MSILDKRKSCREEDAANRLNYFIIFHTPGIIIDNNPRGRESKRFWSCSNVHFIALSHEFQVKYDLHMVSGDVFSGYQYTFLIFR